MRNSTLAWLLVALLPASALADKPKHFENSIASLQVSSSAFANNKPIPSELTCEGAAPAPPDLTWSKVPNGTKSIAILVDDPDAPNGKFTHWLVTNISPKTTSISGALPDGAVASKNDNGTIGYAAPCPPAGQHRYQFRVYALNVDFHNSLTRAEFLRATRGHVLAVGQLIGTYQKHAAQ